MLWIVFFAFLNPPSHGIDADKLFDADMFQPAYGYSLNGTVVLGYLTHIVKLDAQGTLLAAFDQKGKGPRELASGGPMFAVGEDIWINDVMGKKILVLDGELSFKKELFVETLSISMTGPSLALGQLYKLEAEGDYLEPQIFMTKVDVFRNEILSKTFLMGFQPDFPLSYKGILWLEGRTFAVWETGQRRNPYQVWIWEETAGDMRPLSIPIPDFPARAVRSASTSTEAFLQKGMPIIKSLAKIGDQLWAEVQKINPGGDITDQTRYRVTLDYASGKPLKTERVAHKWVVSLGRTDHLILQDEDGNLTLIPKH